MRVRTYNELDLYMEQHPCEQCGTSVRDAGLKLITKPTSAGRMTYTYSGHCRECGNEVRFDFDCPIAWPKLEGFAYGGDEPSDLFDKDQWMAMAASMSKDVPEPSSTLQPRAYFELKGRLMRALAMLSEAKKSGASDIGDGLAVLRNKHDRYLALGDSMNARQKAELAANPLPPIVRFGKEALVAHEQWLARGKTGAGRLVLDKGSVGGMSLGNLKVGGAQLARFDFDRGTVDFAHFEGAELVQCSAEATNFSHANFDGAVLDRCRFTSARMVFSDFKDGRITGGSFQRVNADRGFWNRIQISKADFREAKLGDCVLDGAVLENVDLRDANLSRQSDLKLCSTVDATFRGCDLRGANFEGRRLQGTQLIDCKFAGVKGKPAIEGGYVVVRPDFSAAGDGSDIRSATDVHALWGPPGK